MMTNQEYKKIGKNLYKYKWCPYYKCLNNQPFAPFKRLVYYNGQFVDGVIEANAIEGWVRKAIIAYVNYNVEYGGIGHELYLNSADGGEYYEIKLEGDVVIFSSRVIPGNEKSIFELQNNLYSLGVEIVTEQDRFIHVSGHPSREELEQLYKIIRPKISIPAHGEARHLIEHCLLAESLGVEKTEVIENGQMVCLSDDVCNHVDIIGEVKTGRLAIDGKNIVAYDSPALRARRKIIYNCSAVITIVIDSKCRIVGEPQLSVPGLIDSGTQKEELKAIIKEVRHSLKGMHKNKIKNDDSVSNVVRQAVRRSINNTFGKKPITDVHLVRI